MRIIGAKLEKIQKWFYSRKLKEKIRVLFFMMITAYIVTFFFIYYFFIKSNMLDYMQKSNYNMMVSIGNNLNIEFQAVSTMSQLIMANSNVIEYLRDQEVGKSRVSHNAIIALYDISNTFKYVSSVYVFKNNKEYIHIAREFTYVDIDRIYEPDWQKEIIEKSGSYVMRVNGDGGFNRKTGEPIISFIRLINDMDTQMSVGFIVINLNVDIFKNTFKDMSGEERYFSYYDDQQNVLFPYEALKDLEQMDMNEKRIEQIVRQGFGNTDILSYYHIPDTPFILAASERVSFLKYISGEAFVIILIIIILSILCVGITEVLVSVYIAKPIERLVQYMDSVKSGWNRKENYHKYALDDKIKDLEKRNSQLIEINQIMDELLDKEKAMRKAELEVLREQINPHFLYNTLSGIADLALEASAEEVYDGIETLGNFYRGFLSRGSKEITVGEEIDIIRDYLKLQKLRYQDVFEDIYEVQEDLLDRKVPKLILQPLVENSLYHGLRPKGEKGVIKISVYKEDQVVHIVVFDSGVGMNPEKIEAILSGDHKKGFGLKGTMERIHYYCDREDAFTIRSEEGVYCEVDIQIPL